MSDLARPSGGARGPRRPTGTVRTNHGPDGGGRGDTMPPTECAGKYQACRDAVCCDALYACFQRNGRLYQQCRPIAGGEDGHRPRQEGSRGECVDSEMWLCPRQRAQEVAPPAAPASRAMAAASHFAHALGPGINVMASNIRFHQISNIDLEGLAERVGHVRLCGDLLQDLMDWSNCPGLNWHPESEGAVTEEEAIEAVRVRLHADPNGLRRYKEAAEAVLAHGMRVVLNPLHKKVGPVSAAKRSESLPSPHVLC